MIECSKCNQFATQYERLCECGDDELELFRKAYWEKDRERAAAADKASMCEAALRTIASHIPRTLLLEAAKAAEGKMNKDEWKRQIGTLTCNQCGHQWIGHPDASCPFCEVERLQQRVELLEDAFGTFSHEVTLEDIDSGRVGVVPRAAYKAAEAAEAEEGE